MLRIDLGCGTNKQAGFIGLDRYPLPGVDIVADINRVLPFPDNSCDLLFASHSLEHVAHLLETMKEVYRICKHGAQLSIVAPYGGQRLNQANPYHIGVFNEHTPRFWTDWSNTPVDPEEYYHPQSPFWGLSRSDNSTPGIDLRTVRMECFYFPYYAGLPPSEQRRLRQERTDVCDQIMYHLIVWKGDAEAGGKPFDDYVAEFQPYEPEYMPLLRNRGQEMTLQNGAATAIAAEAAELQSKQILQLSADLDRQEKLLDELRLAHKEQQAALSAALQSRTAEAEVSARQQQELTAEANRLNERCLAQAELLERLQLDLGELRLAHQEQHASLSAARESCAAEAQISARLRQELTGAREETIQLRAHSISLTGEITRLHEHSAAQTGTLSRLTNELQETAAYNRVLRDEMARAERDLEFARADLRRESTAAAASQEQISSLLRRNQDLEAAVESNGALRAKLSLTRAELETTATLLDLERQKEEQRSEHLLAARKEAAAALQETERMRTVWSAANRALSAGAGESHIPDFTQATRVGGFIIGRDTQMRGLPTSFAPLREYGNRQFGAARACIALGGDLSGVPYREYVIPFALDRLGSVSVAIRRLVPESPAVLGVEIVSSSSKILAHARQPLAAGERDGVIEVYLPDPLTGLQKNWALRIFARDAGTPVLVYELIRGGLLRGTKQLFPLVSFS